MCLICIYTCSTKYCQLNEVTTEKQYFSIKMCNYCTIKIVLFDWYFSHMNIAKHTWFQFEYLLSTRGPCATLLTWETLTINKFDEQLQKHTYSHYFLPLEKRMTLHLDKLESPSLKNALCRVLLKLAHWFWREFFKKY